MAFVKLNASKKARNLRKEDQLGPSWKYSANGNNRSTERWENIIIQHPDKNGNKNRWEPIPTKRA